MRHSSRITSPPESPCCWTCFPGCCPCATRCGSGCSRSRWQRNEPPRTFKTLTSLSAEGFKQLLPPFERAWESNLDRRDAGRVRRWAQGEAGGHSGQTRVHPGLFPALPHPSEASCVGRACSIAQVVLLPIESIMLFTGID
jgi:hypothetical protein